MRRTTQALGLAVATMLLVSPAARTGEPKEKDFPLQAVVVESFRGTESVGAVQVSPTVPVYANIRRSFVTLVVHLKGVGYVYILRGKVFLSPGEYRVKLTKKKWVFLYYDEKNKPKKADFYVQGMRLPEPAEKDEPQ